MFVKLSLQNYANHIYFPFLVLTKKDQGEGYREGRIGGIYMWMDEWGEKHRPRVCEEFFTLPVRDVSKRPFQDQNQHGEWSSPSWYYCRTGFSMCGLDCLPTPPPSWRTTGAPRISDGAGDGGCKGHMAFSMGSISLPGFCASCWGAPQILSPSLFTALQIAGLKLSIWETRTLRQLYFPAALELHF